MSENIFEESAKQSKKRLGKPSLVNKPASQKVTNETQTNSEMQKMLGRMQEMREDLEKQLLDLHAKAKAKNLDVERLFGDKYKTLKAESRPGSDRILSKKLGIYVADNDEEIQSLLGEFKGEWQRRQAASAATLETPLYVAKR